jgi:uncharacterized membrane protein
MDTSRRSARDSEVDGSLLWEAPAGDAGDAAEATRQPANTAPATTCPPHLRPRCITGQCTGSVVRPSTGLVRPIPYSRGMPRLRRLAPLLLAGLFTGSGIVHFVRPGSFDAIMPRLLPTGSHRPLIYASGAAELICAVGLFRRAPWASAASTAVLAAVFPANLQMALDSGSGRQPGAMDRTGMAWGRLPLQFLMMWAARQARPAALPGPLP